MNNLMEIITLTHQCLLFRFNGRKYLLGLTATLAQDSASARLKPDHVILPSLPYDAAQSLFLWHLPALGTVNCHALLVADLAVKKRLQALLPTVPELAGTVFKWELLKQHDLVEELLGKVYEELRTKSLPKPLRIEPHGLAFNDSPEKLNVVVPEYGRSLLLVHRGGVVVVDPGENILGTLRHYGMPASALRAVILTNASSLNLFELLLQGQPVTVIASEQVYGELKRQIKAYFFWDEPMIRQRLRGNVMIEQGKWYRHGCLELAFTEDKSRAVIQIDVMFGMKRLRIRPQRLLQYPSELVQLKDLEMLVIYDMQDPIKKELECAPAVYRKRVLFNRPSRKLNNKYFLTLTDPAHFPTLLAHPYAHHATAAPLLDLAFLHRHKDHNYRLQYTPLAHGERFNAAERTVYLREGYLRDEKGGLHSAPEKVSGVREVHAEGNTVIMHELDRNVSFYHGASLIDDRSLLAGEDLLRKVKENSFVRALQRHREGQTALEGEEVERGSEWDVLNGMGSLRTFEAGSEAGRGSLFLVVKGGLKWQGSEAVAGRGMGIGNLRRFYSAAYEDGEEVEAVKDTWAIELPFKDLHARFFAHFPARMYELFAKATVFE